MMKRNILHRLWHTYVRGVHKNYHIAFYLKSFARYYTPKALLRRRRHELLQRFDALPPDEQEYIRWRVDYYCKFSADHPVDCGRAARAPSGWDTCATDGGRAACAQDGGRAARAPIALPPDAPPLSRFTYGKKESYVHDYVNSTYFFDAYEYTRFFPLHLRWAYNPGDVDYLFPLPEITKSRPLTGGDGNRNNILLNLDKVRHFLFVKDPFTWEEKRCKVIFRGDVKGKPHRQRFIDMWKGHPLCDLADTGRLPLYDHLYCRYIMAIEGNDVASNLKWVMSSNSIAVMPRPTCETWYMEGRLKPGYHYVEIAPDYHDLIEKVEYYEAHPDEAKAIAAHAHEWVRQFQDRRREDLISLMVLDKYFRLTGQCVEGGARHMVNEVVTLSREQEVNAQGKVRKDVARTAAELGFVPYDIANRKYVLRRGTRPHHYPFFSQWLAKREGRRFLRQVHGGDTVLIQDFYQDYMQSIATECLRRKAKVVFLVHDVQCIRFNKHTREVRQLNNASLLLVHTEAMKVKLAELGVTTPMVVMQLFDYYSADPMTPAAETAGRQREVVFAGNLAKSAFLRDLLADDSNKGTQFTLYGILGELDIEGAENATYGGVFQPDDTGVIRGGWGLVWDGDSIDSCTGDYGNYLRFNSSHKLSLYLACGLPVIVWEHSSLAEWVRAENIGIVVKTLRHLDSAIGRVSDSSYRQMVDNAHNIGCKLREGYYLKQCLKEGVSKMR